jgi:hypothetical protein
MACGLVGSEEYTNAFVWSDPIEAEGTPQEVAANIAARLEAGTLEIDWRATAERAKKSG